MIIRTIALDNIFNLAIYMSFINTIFFISINLSEQKNMVSI